MKQRHGSKIVRKMSAPQPPYQRLRPFLTEKNRHDLDSELASIDPILGIKRLWIGVRNIFGYFKKTMERAEWGKLVKSNSLKSGRFLVTVIYWLKRGQHS
jgi:hypothetical protein